MSDLPDGKASYSNSGALKPEEQHSISLAKCSCRWFLPEKDGCAFRLGDARCCFQVVNGERGNERKARNISSPRRVILWPCWVSSHPVIRYLKLFPHEKAAEFIGFSADCLDGAGCFREVLDAELGLFQCVHSFSITMSALFLASQILASLCANSVSSNRQELSFQWPS